MKTMLLAIGNAGGNIVETICKESENVALKDSEYIFADCDEDDLNTHKTEECHTIKLDYEEKEFPCSIFKRVEKLFIVAGLGGITGTKFVELAIIAALNANVSSINVFVTIPFSFEGEAIINRAKSAEKKISSINGINTTTFHNDELSEKYADLYAFNAFEKADIEIMQIIEDTI